MSKVSHHGGVVASTTHKKIDNYIQHVHIYPSGICTATQIHHHYAMKVNKHLFVLIKALKMMFENSKPKVLRRDKIRAGRLTIHRLYIVFKVSS